MLSHPPVPPLEAETIKLTAQYTAVGGRSFLAGIAAREERNPAFAFLRPTHALFAYFTQLVDSYDKARKPSTACLGPPAACYGQRAVSSA